MGFQVEDLGKNMMKLVIETSPEAFEEAVKKAYEKNKNKIQLQSLLMQLEKQKKKELIYLSSIPLEDYKLKLI